MVSMFVLNLRLNYLVMKQTGLLSLSKKICLNVMIILVMVGIVKINTEN